MLQPNDERPHHEHADGWRGTSNGLIRLVNEQESPRRTPLILILPLHQLLLLIRLKMFRLWFLSTRPKSPAYSNGAIEYEPALTLVTSFR
ncbi:hypothetical protein SAMN05216525_12334 [Bradyrhizobium sp. Gha]|nr:hypothetical protein SAMN05216525_12334 [Bradyrhizobium sp. Gha]